MKKFKVNPLALITLGALGVGAFVFFKDDFGGDSYQTIDGDFIVSPNRETTRSEVRAIAADVSSGTPDSHLFVDGMDLVAYVESNYKWDAFSANAPDVGVMQYSQKAGPMAELLQMMHSSDSAKFDQIFGEYSEDVRDRSRLLQLDIQEPSMKNRFKLAFLTFKREQIEGGYRWYWLERMGVPFSRNFSDQAKVYAFQLTILFPTSWTDEWFRSANTPLSLHSIVMQKHPRFKWRFDSALKYLESNGYTVD